MDQLANMTSAQLMKLAKKMREEEKKKEEITLKQEILHKLKTPAFKNLKKGDIEDWIVKNIFEDPRYSERKNTNRLTAKDKRSEDSGFFFCPYMKDNKSACCKAKATLKGIYSHLQKCPHALKKNAVLHEDADEKHHENVGTKKAPNYKSVKYLTKYVNKDKPQEEEEEEEE